MFTLIFIHRLMHVINIFSYLFEVAQGGAVVSRYLKYGHWSGSILMNLGLAVCAHTSCNFKDNIYLSNKTSKIKNFVAFITKYIYQPVSHHQQYDGYFTMLWKEKVGENTSQLDLFISLFMLHPMPCSVSIINKPCSRSFWRILPAHRHHRKKQKDPPKGQPDAGAFIILCA